MIPAEWLSQASQRLHGRVERTPLVHDASLDLYLKLENRQRTGSFKLRGAFNKVLSLEPWERQRGLVTASAGNHGQGLALAARESGARVIVFAAASAVPAKLEAMRALGAELRLVEGGYAEAEIAALAFSAESQLTWVSPYNDGQVIAGQASVALEILEQMPLQDGYTIVVPVGGGGLASGIGAAVRQSGHDIRVAGAQSEASPFMHTLYHHGTQEGVVESGSLADGLAGLVEPGSITIPVVQQTMDELVLVSEDEISQAIAYCWYHYGEKIEGSAAAALAAALTQKVADRPAVVVLTGGNIQPEIHREVCSRWRDQSIESAHS